VAVSIACRCTINWPDGALPIDNNCLENRIRPIALGRSNWLFAGSLRAGKRAAAVMSLIQSARLNGHEPYRYVKDVLERLPNPTREPHWRIAAAQLDAHDDSELIARAGQDALPGPSQPDQH
jgi:transposase